MAAIKYLALSSMIVLYSLMFLGGYISAAGLGLTCPEWPLCPDGIMPSEEYLIEWIHRLAAATTGALVVATMIAGFLHRGADAKIRVTSSLATVFVIVQITLGALVIDLKLHAVLVAIHLGIGILLFAMVLLTTLFAFRIQSPAKAVAHGRSGSGGSSSNSGNSTSGDDYGTSDGDGGGVSRRNGRGRRRNSGSGGAKMVQDAATADVAH